MDSDLISTYSTVYGQQDYVNATAVAIVNEESRVGAPLEVAKNPSKLNPTEIETLLIRSAEALDDNYREALKAP
jgi:hypothetical protein